MTSTLPTDSAERKEIPLFAGCFAYFPAALAGVARHSKLGNDRHNPGEPLHHARGKSMDHEDCILRHLMDLADLRARYDKEFRDIGYPERDEMRMRILDEANALAWRALALSQELHEKHGGAPLAPGARLPENAGGHDEGWILYEAGAVDRHPPTISGDTRVDVRLASGVVFDDCLASDLGWCRVGGFGDIVAYRVHV